MRRIFLALVVSLTGALTVPLVAGVQPAAAADPVPARAKLLPTPQINGVVWDQQIYGNTVFVGGEFSSARPFGSAAGNNETTRGNFLSYDLTDGTLNTATMPTFNGAVRDMAIAGNKLVVVGLFTKVNGTINRNRVAVFDLPSMTLNNAVAPSANGPVVAVSVTSDRIFLGGSFTTMATKLGQTAATRAKVASVALSNGTVLGFSLPVQGGNVRGVVTSPDGKQVVIGGNFTSVGGSNNPGYGLYRANALTGAGMALPVNSTYRDAGSDAGVTRLASDGTSFYGSGFVFGDTGNAEGVFQASWSTGALVTLEDCHGDSYDIAPIGSVVYVAAHHHHCLNSGSVIPQTGTSTAQWTNWHSTAWTKAAAGTNTTDSYGYADHPGTPRPKLLPFFPRYAIGSFTGQNQATWTVTGNSSYVLYGGEFTAVNGTSQQGLARFGYSNVSGSTTSGPLTQIGGTSFTPVVRSLNEDEVRISWLSAWDRDDLTLTNQVLRNGTVIWEGDRNSYQWTGAPFSITDTDPGSSPSYQVRISDANGNAITSTTVSPTVAGAGVEADPYTAAVLGDGATKFWRLDEGGSDVIDTAGPDNTTAGSGVGRGAGGAILSDPGDDASTFNGTSSGTIISGDLTMAPNTFSIEAWFKTTTKGGKIAGFGDGYSTDSNHYDRHIYMTSDGRVRFGVAPNGVGQRDIGSPTGVNMADGEWHQAVATLGPAGMKLYIDGSLVQQWADYTSGENIGGRWRVGGDSTWRGAPKYFNGSIDDFSVYGTQLSAAQVAQHYQASGRTPSTRPTPPSASIRAAARGKRVSYYGTVSTTDRITSYRWDFGDGTGATTRDAGHLYRLPGTYNVTFTATDSFGQSTTRGARVTVANARPVAKIVAGIKKKKRVNLYGTQSSDVDGRIVRYHWRFGDGKVATGAAVGHKYKKAKRYTVRLTVTDENGASTTVVRRIKTKR